MTRKLETEQGERELAVVGGFVACESSDIAASLRYSASCDQVTFAVGGNYVEYRRGSVRVKQPGTGNENPRGDVSSFSEKSRRRMLKFVNSINRDELQPGSIWFLTLTYPDAWPGDWEVWKKQLNHWRMKLERAWGGMAAVWKIEPQKRGAPHFHVMLRVPPSFSVGLEYLGMVYRRNRWRPNWRGGRLQEFRTWLSRSWYEVVRSGDEDHLAAGTNCEPMQAWGQAIAYAAKYLGKNALFVDKETGEMLNAGRFWGVWWRDEWPIRLASAVVPEEAWIPIRRTVRRYLEKQRNRKAITWRKHELSSCSVFLPGKIIARLIDHHCWWRRTSGWKSLTRLRERWARIADSSRDMRFVS